MKNIWEEIEKKTQKHYPREGGYELLVPHSLVLQMKEEYERIEQENKVFRNIISTHIPDIAKSVEKKYPNIRMEIL